MAVAMVRRRMLIKLESSATSAALGYSITPARNRFKRERSRLPKSSDGYVISHVRP